MRAKARNFAWGLRLTPRPQRDALYAAYAWMRQGDDIADDIADKPTAARELAAFRVRTLALLDPALSDPTAPTPADDASCWPALAWSLRHARLPADPLLEMLEGLAWDLAHAPFVTEDQLDRYCALVGGTVGVVCTTVWGLRPAANHAAALREADLRGKAFQAINIARDVAEDARAARHYLPAAWLDAEGLTRETFLAWRDDRACSRVLARLFAKADGCLRDSRDLCSRIDPACVPTLTAMTSIYGALLDKLRDQPCRAVLGPRVRLPAWRKALLALRSLRTPTGTPR